MKRIGERLAGSLQTVRPQGRLGNGTVRGVLAREALAAKTKVQAGLEPLLRRPKPEKIYGRIGNLEVRLAASRRDIREAQRLRYEVFYEEMSAKPSIVASMRRLDQDPYDSLCDHLLVVDRASPQGAADVWQRSRDPKVVGTYRVLRQEVAQRALGFYTAGEYDIGPMLAAKSPRYRFMELGRSCVLRPYRTKRSVELLWHGLWTYVREHKVDVMIGCASFEGTDPKEHAEALSFLHHFAKAPATGAAAPTLTSISPWI